MRFAFLSIVNLRDVPFISLLIYQTDIRGVSTVIGEIAKPYEDINDLLDDLTAYEIDELQTDSKDLYREFVKAQYPALYRRELADTHQAVTLNEELLIEIYELDKQDEESVPGIPSWRLWCIEKLEKLIQLLKTKGIKTDDN